MSIDLKAFKLVSLEVYGKINKNNSEETGEKGRLKSGEGQEQKGL